MKAKIVSIICAAVCFACMAVCLGAYVFSNPSHTAEVSGEGVNNASSYLAMAVTPPSGNEQGISPLVIGLVIDCAALSDAGMSGECTLSIRITLNVGEDVAAAKYALSQAVCSATVGGEACAAECAFSGDDDNAALTVAIPLTAPREGSLKAEASVSFPSEQAVVDLFRKYSSRLFDISALIL